MVDLAQVQEELVVVAVLQQRVFLEEILLQEAVIQVEVMVEMVQQLQFQLALWLTQVVEVEGVETHSEDLVQEVLEEQVVVAEAVIKTLVIQLLEQLTGVEAVEELVKTKTLKQVVQEL